MKRFVTTTTRQLLPRSGILRFSTSSDDTFFSREMHERTRKRMNSPEYLAKQKKEQDEINKRGEEIGRAYAELAANDKLEFRKLTPEETESLRALQDKISIEEEMRERDGAGYWVGYTDEQVAAYKSTNKRKHDPIGYWTGYTSEQIAEYYRNKKKGPGI